jgi:hypothetical protein
MKLNKLEYKFILIIFIISVLIRFSYSFYQQKYNDKIQKWDDDFAYLNYAENIRTQGVFVLNIEKLSTVSPQLQKSINFPLSYTQNFLAVTCADVAPIYPLILSGLLSIFGYNFLVIFFINSIVASFTPILIYLLARELFNRKIAFIALILSSLYYFYIVFVPHLLKEIWIYNFIVLSFYFFFRVVKNSNRNDWKQVFLLSFSLSLTFHTDERYLMFAPIFAISILLWKIYAFKRNLIKSAIFTTFIVLMMIPWTIRNYFAYDKFILLTNRSEFLTDKLIYPNEVKKYSANSNIKVQILKDNYELTSLQIDSVKKHGTLVVKPNGTAISREEANAIITGKSPFPPNNELLRVTKGLIEFWSPVHFISTYRYWGYDFYPKWSLAKNALYFLSYGTVLILSFIGIFFLFKIKKWNLLIFFLTILIAQTAFHYYIFDNLLMRYRTPVDFILIIIGSYGLYMLLKNNKLATKYVKCNKN